MKPFFLLIFLWILTSCNSQEIKTIETKLQIRKKITLDTEENYPDVTTRAYGIIANHQTGFDIIAPNLNSFLRYDFSGKNTLAISKEQLPKDYLLPTGFPAAFTWNKDTLLLLYPSNNTIYKIKEKNVVGKVEIKIPNKQVIVRGTPLFYVSENNTCIISIGTETDATKDFFSKSKPFHIFSMSDGSYLKSFGEYPKSYAQGKTILEGLLYLKSIREKDKIYCLFPHFDNIIEFDIFGNKLRTLRLANSIYRDTTLKVIDKKLDEIKKSEINKYQNDTYRGGIAKIPNQEAFFTLYFSHKKGREVLKFFDVKNKISKESIIPLELGSCHLFPIASEQNTCFLLSMNPQSDEVYIYEVQME